MKRGGNCYWPVGIIPSGIVAAVGVNPNLRSICLTACTLFNKAVASLLTVPSPPTQVTLKKESRSQNVIVKLIEKN